MLIYRTFTLFSKSLPLDAASRVWDVFCRDGEAFLFRAALGEYPALLSTANSGPKTNLKFNSLLWNHKK